MLLIKLLIENWLHIKDGSRLAHIISFVPYGLIFLNMLFYSLTICWKFFHVWLERNYIKIMQQFNHILMENIVKKVIKMMCLETKF